MGAMAEPGTTRLTGWGITAPTVYWWTPAGEWGMTAMMLMTTLWLAVAATSVTVCASWGVAQALAKMKESARPPEIGREQPSGVGARQHGNMPGHGNSRFNF